MAIIACAVCATPLVHNRVTWLLRCPSCGFLQSLLQPQFNDLKAREHIDLTQRHDAFKALREQNYRVLLDRLLALKPGRRLLEVGCAQGWFLAAAAERGFESLGIEADVNAGDVHPPRVKIVQGLFPAAVPPRAVFDVIVFNDVLEHIPNVETVLADCRALLAPGGVLVVNAPDRRGIFYRLATVLAACGLTRALERLWQKGFPSPHLYYFAPDDLKAIGRRHGLVEQSCSHLSSLQIKGLWARIRYDSSVSWVRSAVLWAGLLPICLVLEFLPADISLQFFRAD